MNPWTRPTAPLLAVLLVVSACSGAAAPSGGGPSSGQPASPVAVVATASPSPSPSPRPTPSPTARPVSTPTPAATIGPDLAATLRIGKPYTLGPAGDAAMQMQFAMQIAGTSISATMFGRVVDKAGKPVGAAFIEHIDGIPMSAQVFESGANGAATSAGGKLTWAAIGGRKVAMIAAPSGKMAMVRWGDSFLMAAGKTIAEAKAMMSALLAAN